MNITEPMTMATDYLLGVMAITFGVKLWRNRMSEPHPSKAPLALAFWSLAAASLIGGSHHGFYEVLSSSAARLTWYLTLVSIGAASACLFVAVSRAAFSVPIAKTLTLIGSMQFLAYSVWVWSHPEFFWAIVDYAPTMGYLLIVGSVGWVHGVTSGKWAVGGVLVSLGAAAVQQSGFAIHEHFNHNDLYHVVQMFGVFLLYRAGVLIQDSGEGSKTQTSGP